MDPFTQVKSAEHMAKFNTKSISNRGTFCNFSLAPKRKIYTGLLIFRGKKAKFHGIFRGKFAEKSADFAGKKSKFAGKSFDFAGV